MKKRLTLILLAAGVLAGSAVPIARAQDQENDAPKRPTREEWQKMTPEKRPAWMQELRAQRGKNPPMSAEEMSKLRQELRDLPPAQREARMKEVREKYGLPEPNPEMQKRHEELMKLSPEERRARIEELRRDRPGARPLVEDIHEQRRAALMKKLADLRARKAEGKLSDEETKLLENLERASRLFEERPPSRKPAPEK